MLSIDGLTDPSAGPIAFFIKTYRYDSVYGKFSIGPTFNADL